jgi:predicted Zn-dependent protease with MMP-like domain
MERQEFESLVHKALGGVPEQFRRYLENVDVIVDEWPSQDQLAGHLVDDDDLLLGLYEGVPLTERADYLDVLPDRITIFQRSIEAICENDEQTVEEVRTTVIHEIAHHFGIDDLRLEELGV